MILSIDIFNYILAATMICVSLVWFFLIRKTCKSYIKPPYLDNFEKKKHSTPKVSIILPARNEEQYIEKCLNSLVEQDYVNYEIITIDDSSEDATGEIINRFSAKNPKVVYVSARQKPDGWIGKNWACNEGYKKATGDLLLFTDADTKHSKNVITLAVSHLLSSNLDALTVFPRLLCLDYWTRIAFLIMTTLVHSRFLAIDVNDPSKKVGYFIGSFFIIKKHVYDAVGTHEGVKHEIFEDGALGRKVKEAGYKMKVANGEHLIDAVLFRDISGLLHSIRKMVVPLYLQSSSIAFAFFFGALFLLFIPFPILAYSILCRNIADSFSFLMVTSSISCSSIYLGAIIEARRCFQLKVSHALMCPIGSFLIIVGLLSGIIQAKSDTAISWRGRNYSRKDILST